jgi:hypothetical protein
MHQRFVSAAVVALTIVVRSLPLAAQSTNSWLVAGGLSVPAGVLGTYANMGWDVTVGAEHRFGRHPSAVRIDLAFAQNTDTTGVGFHETTRLITGFANLVYHFQGARPHLYALVGVGYFGRRFSSEDPDDPTINDTRLGLQFGEGVMFRVKSATLFLEGRFVTGVGPQPLRFFPVVIGFRLGGSQQ